MSDLEPLRAHVAATSEVIASFPRQLLLIASYLYRHGHITAIGKSMLKGISTFILQVVHVLKRFS